MCQLLSMLRRNIDANEAAMKSHAFWKAKKNRRIAPAVFYLKTRNELDFLDRLEHLECGFVRANEKTLKVFTQTLALQRIATCALFFTSHVDLLNVIANSESIEL